MYSGNKYKSCIPVLPDIWLEHHIKGLQRYTRGRYDISMAGVPDSLPDISADAGSSSFTTRVVTQIALVCLPHLGLSGKDCFAFMRLGA